MKKDPIHLSKSLRMPSDAVTQTFAVIGKRGSGKTNTASVLFEQFVKAGLPAVYVDPIGVTWGLRHSRDGKSAGLPVIILGGEHADVPLEETGGIVIADFIIESRQPIVLDLGLFSKGAQRRFMVDFAERLYHKNREALHVMLDECDTWVPQRAEHGTERLAGAINDLVRKGRARGIGITLISQRPAVINKDVLTQIETLVAHRVTAPHDRDAVEKWIEYQASGGGEGSLVSQDDVLASLQSLGDGDAWVWSPSWLGTLQRVHVDLRETFDSSATPKAGARVATPKHAAEVDLGKLRDQLAATIEKVKADDPKELRRKIAELEKQLRAVPVAPPKTVEVPILTKEQEKRLLAIRDELATLRGSFVKLDQKVEALHATYMDHRRDAVTLSLRVDAMLDQIPRGGPLVVPVGAPPRAVTTPKAARVSTAPAPRYQASSGEESNGELPKGERAVLTAIAQNPDGATRNQISALTGYKQQTRDTYVSRLTAKGFVAASERGGLLLVTADGMVALGPSFQPLPTGTALIDYWKNKLPKGEGLIFTALVEAWPESVTREELTEKTGFAQQTRDTYISRLLRNKIIDKPLRGEPIRASEALMTHAR